MNIRKAVQSDTSVILSLVHTKAEFDREMKGFHGEVTSSEEKIKNTLFNKNPFAYALLLEEGGQVLGFALYHYRYSSFKGEPSVWLDDLIVLEENRSKAYGYNLMQALKGEAIKIGASHIGWTASPLNVKGQNFYNKIGAKIDAMNGSRPFYSWSVNA